MEAGANVLGDTAQRVEEATRVQLLVKWINLTDLPDNMESVRITDPIVTGSTVTAPSGNLWFIEDSVVWEQSFKLPLCCVLYKTGNI